MNPFQKLIIFDCDGTLVNSEYLYNTITAKLLNEIGYPEYTPELCLELFAGQSWSTIRTELEIQHQTKMPDDIIPRYIRIANEEMNHDFEAAPYADAMLDEVSRAHAICVGSNGERKNVIKSLDVTGLLKYFTEDTIFTKIQVPKPKPAPDLFLFACEKMGYAPSDTVVIEDSIAGVRAAVAANIRVVGYVGTSHAPQEQAKKLGQAGAHAIIQDLRDFSALLA